MNNSLWVFLMLSFSIYAYVRFGHNFSTSTNIILFIVNIAIIYLKIHLSNKDKYPKLHKKVSDFDNKFQKMIERNSADISMYKKKDED